jgi:glycosidase
MKVIIDWVANHTSWDNVWIASNPEFYTKNEKGEMMMPEGTDWADVADLNFENQDLRKKMTEALQFWIKEADIDGYRCDVAGMIPVDFWDNVRAELDKIKPVFMLAEAEEPPLHEKAFDMAYSWTFHHIMNHIAQGKKDASEVDKYFLETKDKFPAGTYMMNFITNHDENAWNGTEKERLGIAVETMAALSFTVPGMPLLYTGQEVGLAKRLSFFEKDLVEWKTGTKEEALYKNLIKLKKDNSALWNGVYGADLVRVNSDNDKAVFAFIRENENNKVFAVFNLSAKPLKIKLQGDAFVGKYTDFSLKTESELKAEQVMSLNAWEYKIFTSTK